MGKATTWLWGLLATAGALQAGVEVVPAAARTGDYGLRAEVVPGCEGEEVVLLGAPVEGVETVEACREVVVAAEVPGGGELAVAAGERVAFVDGFSVASGGRLVAGTTGAWNPGYVIDETPAGEGELHVRWYARLDEAGLAAEETVTLLRVVAAGVPRGWVRYEASVGGGEVWVEVLDDGGAVTAGERRPLAGGWHRLELDWVAGSLLAPTGEASLQVDGGAAVAVTGLALAGAPADEVELGVVEASTGGGWIDLDDYWSGRGPAPAQFSLPYR